MKRLAWSVITGVVVLLALGGVILLMANLYVQSPAMQLQIRRELSASLHMPATIRKTTFTPWDGLRIDGIAAPAGGAVPDAAPSPVGLKAGSFRARFAFSPLFQHRLVVREILFDRPEVIWARDAEGRWSWPGTPREAAPPEEPATEPTASATPEGAPGLASSTPAVSPAQSPSPAASPPSTPGAQASETAPSVPPSTTPAPIKHPAFPLAVEIAGFKVRHGALHLLDFDRAVYATFEDVNIDGILSGMTRVRGLIRIEHATLQNRYTVTNFESAYDYRDEAFELKNAHGDFADGQLAVEYSLRRTEPGSPFSAVCRLSNISLAELLKQSAQSSVVAEGRLDGVVELKGLSDDSSTQAGTAHLQITGAEVSGSPVLDTIASALRIDDLGRLRFQTAQAECHIEGTTVTIDSLDLAAPDLRLSVHGVCLLDDRTMNLQARLTLDQRITHQLPSFIEQNFIPVAEALANGDRYIDFTISGPIDNPRTDLVDRVVAKPLRSMFQDLLGTGSSHRKSTHERKAKPGAAATPGEAATPAAAGSAPAATTPESTPTPLAASPAPARHS